jgi:hypothetical protein
MGNHNNEFTTSALKFKQDQQPQNNQLIKQEAKSLLKNSG